MYALQELKHVIRTHLTHLSFNIPLKALSYTKQNNLNVSLNSKMHVKLILVLILYAIDAPIGLK